MNTIGIALSGLNAAQVRLGNSANNVANAQSTSSLVNGKAVERAYQPTDVSQRSIEPTGGVDTSLRTREAATVPVYLPNHPAADEDGIVQVPNVDLAEEAVERQFATYDFKANLKAIKAQNEMMKNLLDIYA